MRFHALFPVRDEADIIGQSLTHMLRWADQIYVFDTGSIDTTWEIIQDLAANEKRIIPLKKDTVFFSDTCVRGWIFHQARNRMRNGDWFLRVDADEFHAILPPEFVRTRLQAHETVVWHQYYNFQLTESEAKACNTSEDIFKDRQRPIEERRRWFTSDPYSEPRMCQYRDTMRWSPTVSFPYNSGFVAHERLPIRHYPNRDPLQMERRYMLRNIMRNDEQNRTNFGPYEHHWSEQEWRTFLMPDDSPGLKYWHPGDALPEYRYANHLSTPIRRALQRLIHACCLPVLDRIRPGWPEATYPQRISDDVVATLKDKLRV